ncbi:MAG: hypothetical protein MMC23_002794 [Stictis urceolatum]|nr:hypothetical protein [Stictis urceolata]
MPLIDLYLFTLSAPIARFLSSLRSALSSNDIIAISKPRFLYIPSTSVDSDILNNTKWDLFLLVRQTAKVSADCTSLISKSYKLTVGVPGKSLAAYPEHNLELLRDAPNVKLTGALDKALATQSKARSSGDNLELSDDLISFMKQMVADGQGSRPISMLNLLRFHDGGRDGYAKYGQGFRGAGGRRGGDAKIVGTVVGKEGAEKSWDEIAFVHYPR